MIESEVLPAGISPTEPIQQWPKMVSRVQYKILRFKTLKFGKCSTKGRKFPVMFWEKKGKLQLFRECRFYSVYVQKMHRKKREIKHTLQAYQFIIFLFY